MIGLTSVYSTTTMLASYDNNLVVIGLEYDMATQWVTGIRCVNNSPGAVRVDVFRASDNLLYSQRFTPGEGRMAIPTTAGERIALTAPKAVRFAGFRCGVAYPVP